jgi:hypothetical protein
MSRVLPFVGLGVAVLSALTFAILPAERALGMGLLGLGIGFALLLVGLFTTLAARRRAISAAMRRFAEVEGLPLREALAADDLPAIGPFRRGTRRRCDTVLGVVVAGHEGLLFRLEYYVPSVGHDPGAWDSRLVLYLPRAWANRSAFRLTPSSFATEVATWVGSQDVNLGNDEFSRVFRLQAEDEPSVRRLFGATLRGELARHPELAVHAEAAALVVWEEAATITHLRLGWRRSFESFEEWVSAALRERLAVAETLLRHDDAPAGG